MWMLTLILAFSSGVLQVESIPMRDKEDCIKHAEAVLRMDGYDFDIVFVTCNRVEEI